MKLFAIVGLLGANAIRTSQENFDVANIEDLTPSEAKSKSIDEQIEQAGQQLLNEKKEFEQANAEAG